MSNDTDFINTLIKEIADPYEKLKLNIFLCGENPQFVKKGITTQRELLDKELNKDSKCFVVYPEWLFPELMAKGKNLLELESRLVDMVDSVVIPLSTISTFTELGAFTGNQELIKKVIVINDSAFENEKSFVNIGPIALIKEKAHKRNVIWYNNFTNDIEEIASKVVNRTKGIISDYGRNEKNIFKLSTYIQFIISLYQPINVRNLKLLLKPLDGFDLDSDFDPAIKILFEKGLIEIERKIIKNKKFKYFKLSNLGHSEIIERRLEHNHLKKKYYSIRSKAIKTRYESRYDINFYGRKHFLEDFNIEIS